ncbi:MAG: hypothetical protein AAF624_00515 [Bacteroidota bacterium]
MPNASPGKPSALDQHATKLIAAVLTALLLWVGSSLTRQAGQLERQSVQIAEMQRRLDAVGGDRYTNNDAARDFARVEVLILELKRRVGDVETAMDDLEDELRDVRAQR